MKRKKSTAITLTLAAAVVSATLGGALLGKNVSSSADDAATYELTNVFTVSNDATVAADSTDAAKTAFTLPNDGSVTFARNLAFKWFEKSDSANYLTLKFSFKDANFKTVTFSFDSPSAWATKDDKATNVVTFTKNAEGNVEVKVNGNAATTIAAADVNKALTLQLGEKTDANDGEFTVSLSVDGTAQTMSEDSKFTNVGANYATYSKSSKTYPLVVTAELADDAAENASTVVLLSEINGQKFDELTEDGKVTDNAAPVLVLNEILDGFTLGTAFSLDYTVVDVLYKSTVTPSLTYYQYDPTVTEELTEEEYRELDTSVYFLERGYWKGEGDAKEWTSMFKENKAEYYSIKAELDDGSKSANIDLSWYATSNAVKTFSSVAYIKADNNKDGATYSNISLDDVNYKNRVAVEWEEYGGYEKFDADLTAAAKDKTAGSNSTVNIPSMKWLINDNNGYRNLKFTISYYKPSSSTGSPSTNSGLSYNGLTISVEEQGEYEFKVFAVDGADNAMKYYDEDGELVSVTSDNVWDIEEIPSFSFYIANTGIQVEEPDSASDKKDTVLLNKTYTMDDIDVTGVTSTLKEDYALYKIDLSKYNETATRKISQSALTSVDYEKLNAALDISSAENKDYFGVYLTAYAKLLAEGLDIDSTDGNVAKIVACFEKIGEVGDRKNGAMDEDGNYIYEDYNWSATSQSFSTIEEGMFFILADYSEAEQTAVRATAYKLVIVDSEADSIKGETEWLKNNVASVVLFSIAGVLLILIIILLLVKPSDETLDDVDAKAKKAEKKKKNK